MSISAANSYFWSMDLEFSFSNSHFCLVVGLFTCFDLLSEKVSLSHCYSNSLITMAAAAAATASIHNGRFLYIYCTTGTDQKIMNINVRWAYFAGEMIYFIRLLMCVSLPFILANQMAQHILHLVSFIRINYHFRY